MKKAALMIFAALTLSGCAPALEALQSPAAKLTKADGAVTFANTAKTAAEAPVIYLRGEGLEVSARFDKASPDACTPLARAGAWLCYLPDVAGGEARSVDVTGGKVDYATANFYRAETGARLITIALQ